MEPINFITTDPSISNVQDEIAKWISYNFSQRESFKHHLYHCLLGLVEEADELEHAIGTGMESDIEDAAADACIFMMDYCNAEAIDFYEQVFKKHTYNAGSMSLLKCLARVMRAKLKRDEGVRNNSIQDTLEALQSLTHKLRIITALYGIDLEKAIVKTWLKVRTRDWVQYPETGRPHVDNIAIGYDAMKAFDRKNPGGIPGEKLIPGDFADTPSPRR